MDFEAHPALRHPPVTLERQLAAAAYVDACFCVACGQPDEPSLHDSARCAGMGGTNDTVTIATALAMFDASCSEEPDLDDHARALHCIIVAMGGPGPEGEGSKLGDGSGDAAIVIGEHAFRAGYNVGYDDGYGNGGAPRLHAATGADRGWSDYEPPEHIKALS